MASENCLVDQCSPEQRQGGHRGTGMLQAVPTSGSVLWVRKRLQIPHTQVKSFLGNSSYFRQNDGN